MEIHNITEDIVFNSVQTIFEVVKRGAIRRNFAFVINAGLTRFVTP